MVVHPSLASTMNTDIKASIKQLKFESGQPPSQPSFTGISFSSKLTLYAKISIPRRVQVKINKNSKTEKLLMSLIVLPIVRSKFQNYFQVLASLKTLRSLNALRAEIAPEPTLLFSKAYVSTTSTHETITITQSNVLKLSLKYCLSPIPTSLITISRKNTTKKNRLRYSSTSNVVQSMGCLS